MTIAPHVMTLRELADAVKAGVLTYEQVQAEAQARKAMGLDLDEPREKRTNDDPK